VRIENVVVSSIGVAATLVAVLVATRWWRLPVRGRPPATGDHAAHAADAFRTIGATLAAGCLAGLLVVGGTGRLVMRILGATSPEVQGRLTDAGERVGEITLTGSLGFALFGGLAAGVLGAGIYLVVRPLAGARAGLTGLVTGVLLTATLGVDDPLSPDNSDFTILGPTWLAILLLLATATLFGITTGSLAARLQAVADGDRWTRWLPCAALVVALLPPLPLVVAAYVAGRAAAAGRLTDRLEAPPATVVGRIATVAAVAVAGIVTLTAVGDILL
jgi:hypothetical protein